jgi:hypothetical protein
MKIEEEGGEGADIRIFPVRKKDIFDFNKARLFNNLSRSKV